MSHKVKSSHDCPFCGYALRIYTDKDGIVSRIVKGEDRVKIDPFFITRRRRYQKK